MPSGAPERPSEPSCRNLHGQLLDRSSPTARFGLGNMTYDAAARHPAFCARPAQLYDLEADPLEQTDLAPSRPDVYARLLDVLLAHVRTVEAGNPAIARQGAESRLGCAAPGATHPTAAANSHPGKT